VSSGSGSPARVSLRDVARAVGVSHMAVSLALRDDPRVSEARRREIRAKAEQLGYRPDPMLSSLAAYRNTRRSTTVRATVAWLNQWADPRALRRLRVEPGTPVLGGDRLHVEVRRRADAEADGSVVARIVNQVGGEVAVVAAEVL